MRRYLEQVACVLRPGSVSGADLALRSFAAFLAEAPSPASSLAQVTRRHVEDFKPWLAARPGQNKPRLTPATIAHRLGTLRMFFARIDRMGLGRGPAAGADVPRRPAPPGPPPAQGPRRRHRREAAPRRPGRPPDAGPASPSRCCCAPGCGSANTPACAPTRSCSSAPGPGCMSRSASSTRTATCRCTRSWSP